MYRNTPCETLKSLPIPCDIASSVDFDDLCSHSMFSPPVSVAIFPVVALFHHSISRYLSTDIHTNTMADNKDELVQRAKLAEQVNFYIETATPLRSWRDDLQ